MTTTQALHHAEECRAYAGILFGFMIVTATCPRTGQQVTYIPADFTSRKGCRVFRMQVEPPF